MGFTTVEEQISDRFDDLEEQVSTLHDKVDAICDKLGIVLEEDKTEDSEDVEEVEEVEEVKPKVVTQVVEKKVAEPVKDESEFV